MKKGIILVVCAFLLIWTTQQYSIAQSKSETQNLSTSVQSNTSSRQKKPAILALYESWLMNPGMDPVYRKKLEKDGFEIRELDYKDLSWDVAKQFNVIAVERTWFSDNDATKISVINKFLEEGGGVVVFNDAGAYVIDLHEWLNELVQPWGAEFLNEIVIDFQHTYVQKQPLFYRYCYTGNIKPHPLTEGVKEWWYITGGNGGGWSLTNAIKTDDNWDVVIRGEKSAFSHEPMPTDDDIKNSDVAERTYKSEPPLVVARDYKKGRIVLIPIHSAMLPQSGYHEIWENGILFNRGDGERFMLNMWNWLAEPSLANDTLGGYVEPPAKPVEKITLKTFDVPVSAERIFPHVEVNGNPSLMSRGNSTTFVKGTDDDAGFRSYNEGKDLTYTITLPDGTYSVGLGLLTGIAHNGESDKYEITVNGAKRNVSYPPIENGLAGRLETFVTQTENGRIVIHLLGMNDTNVKLSVIDVANDENYAHINLGSYEDPSFATPVTTGDALVKTNRQWEKGVIGVRTIYSDGNATIAQYAKLAKEMGLGYIVFTDRLEDLNKEKWNTILEDCKAASDETFAAIPGFSGKDGYNNYYYCFNTPNDRFPTDEERQTIQTGGAGIAAIFNMDWPNITFSRISQCGWYPWLIKFYTGIDLFTYDNNSQIISDTPNWYENRVFTDYIIAPLVSHEITDLDGLRNVKGSFTYVPVDMIAGLPYGVKKGPRETLADKLKQSFKIRTTQVSEGPLLNDLSIKNVVGQGQLHAIELNVISELPLQTVTVWNGGRIYRRFRPEGKEFEASVPVANVGDRNFIVEVRDIDGNHGYSFPLKASNQSNRFTVFMCADQQNTIESYADYHWDKSVMTMGLLTGWDFWGALLMVPENDLTPKNGFEGMVMSMSGLGTDFAFFEEDGTENPIPERNTRLSNDEVVLIDNHYATQVPVRASLYSNIAYMLSPMQEELGNCKMPTTQADSLVRYIRFRPKMYSNNITLVDITTKFLKDIHLTDKDGLEVILTNPAGKYVMGVKSAPDGHSRFPQYWYLTRDGEKVHGKTNFVNNEPTIISAPLAQNGYAAIGPDRYGTLGVFAVTDKDYDIAIGNTYDSPWREDIAIGYDMPNGRISKGTVWNDRFLIMLDNGKPDDDAAFSEVYDKYGFDATPAYNVEMFKGELLNDVYFLEMNADDNEALFKVSQAKLPEDLGIMVHGVCDNWDSAIFDGQTFRRIESYDGTAYATIDVSGRDRNVFIGNLIQGNNENVIINVLKPSGNEIVYEVHNPTDEVITTHVTGTKQIAGYNNIDRTFELQPGETISQTIPTN